MAGVEDQWVLFKLGESIFSLNIQYVKEMTQMDHITPVPNTPPDIMGTMRLRDRVVPIIDLRVRLGFASLESETDALIDLLVQREKDHVHWVEELENCIRGNRTFTLARDPHRCAFGQWYDRFKTSDRILEGQLRKFDAPHKAIHAVADEALGLLSAGDSNGALGVVNRTRDRELSQLLTLFDQTRVTIRERTTQIAIILEDQGRFVGLAVDEILSVLRIREDGIQPPPTQGFSTEEQFITGVAESEVATGGLILLLDAKKLMGTDLQLG